MRVNAATGAPINDETGLLDEIRASIRDRNDGQPTVVRAILDQTNVIRNELRRLGPGGMPPGGGDDGGDGGDYRRDREIFIRWEERIEDILSRMERAVTGLEGGATGQQGERTASYFQNEFYIRNTLRSIQSISDELFNGSLRLANVRDVLKNLTNEQFKASIGDLLQSFIGTALHATNLTTAFRNLHHSIQQQIVDLREGGVFGSNMLSPMEFFLEGLTRIREGIFTTSDSFRTVTNLVRESIERGVLSPLLMTGRAASELAGDLSEAREDMRAKFGIDTRAWMSTNEANGLLLQILEVQKKFGIQAQLRDITTETRTAQELNFLRVIAAMTGETVGKLSEQLRIQRQQQELLIGLGRLNQQEYLNFTANQKVLDTLGPSGKALIETMTRMLASGRTPQEMIASNPELATFAASQPAMFSSLIRLIDQMTRQSTPEQIRAIVAELGGGTGGAGFRSMHGLLQQIYGGFRDSIAGMTIAGDTARGVIMQSEAQQARAQSNPTWALIQRVAENFQELLKPLFRLETAILGQIVATIANTGALWMAAASYRGASLGGMLGALGRVAGPLAGAAVGAGTAYASGSSTEGIVGAAGGSLAGGLAGAALGSALGPIGTIIGMAAGTALGGFIGEKLGSAIAGPSTPSPLETLQQKAAAMAPVVVQTPSTPQGKPDAARASTETITTNPQLISMAMRPEPVVIERPTTESPAVPPPVNVFGPEYGAPQVDSSRSLAYQDSTVNLLSKLIYTTEDGNVRLSQIHGELARQTQYLGSDVAAGSTPASAMGLSATGVSSRSMLGRPDDSTPYVRSG